MTSPSPALLRPAFWTGALWAWRARRSVHRQLATTPLAGVRVPTPPPDRAAGQGAGAVLERLPGTCLERALVRQAWHAAGRERRDVVIGVTGPGEPFGAHAWLAGDAEDEASDHEVLLRHPAP